MAPRHTVPACCAPTLLLALLGLLPRGVQCQGGGGPRPAVVVTGCSALAAAVRRATDEEEDLPHVDVKCEVRDSDAALFTWKIYYAMALANLVEIHLETLDKRRISLVK